MDNNQAVCIWFTGLSGAGKSTLANGMAKFIRFHKLPVVVLDGDKLRQGFNSDLDYSLDDRQENIRRTSEVAKVILDSGVNVIASFISPTEQIRSLAKQIIGEDRFKDVFVNASLETCIKRDPKGLYKKALSGQIKDFTGIASIYEAPLSPSIIIDTDLLTLEQAISQLEHFWQAQKTFGLRTQQALNTEG